MRTSNKGDILSDIYQLKNVVRRQVGLAALLSSSLGWMCLENALKAARVALCRTEGKRNVAYQRCVDNLREPADTRNAH